MDDGSAASSDSPEDTSRDQGFFAQLATRIEENGFYRMLVALGALTILGLGYTAFDYLAESDERAKNRRYEAWSFLMAASGPLGDASYDMELNCKVANWGLVEPLQQLVNDDVKLESLRLPNAYLKGMEVPGISMPNAFLFCATLDNSNLRGADLSHGRLKDANLSCVDLTGANLRDADLSKANLRRANLTSANLESVDLSHARLRGTILVGANFEGTDFHAAELDQTDLRAANLTDAKNLEATQLKTACLSRATTVLPENLQGMKWPEACPVDPKGYIVIRNKRDCD